MASSSAPIQLVPIDNRPALKPSSVYTAVAGATTASQQTISVGAVTAFELSVGVSGRSSEATSSQSLSVSSAPVSKPSDSSSMPVLERLVSSYLCAARIPVFISALVVFNSRILPGLNSRNQQSVFERFVGSDICAVGIFVVLGPARPNPSNKQSVFERFVGSGLCATRILAFIRELIVLNSRILPALNSRNTDLCGGGIFVVFRPAGPNTSNKQPIFECFVSSGLCIVRLLVLNRALTVFGPRIRTGFPDDKQPASEHYILDSGCCAVLGSDSCLFRRSILYVALASSLLVALDSTRLARSADTNIAASHRNDSVPFYRPETSSAATLASSQGTSSEASPPTIILSAQSTLSSVVSVSSSETLDVYPAATEGGPGYGAHVPVLDYDNTGPTDKPDLRLATETTADLAHTSSVPAEMYAKAVAKAKHLNGLYSKLSPHQACSPQQVACIEGKVARCNNGAFDLEACKGADEQCWALPLNGQAYIALACVSRDRALEILGPDGVAHATEKAAATTTSERVMRPVVTMTTVVTIVDNPTPHPAPSASSLQPCPSDSPLSEACSPPPIPSSSRAPTGKPGFVMESGPIAGPTPTITIPYLVSTPSPPIRAPASPPNPTALVVMPIEDYGRALSAPPTVSIYVTVTVTEKERETLAVTVTMPLR
ncbi:hypothetical protein CDD80_166 [Ophiocordyceps camponoti-rufipedis]|uniref:Uncharacterized protein n=1 Tax=Ophiocordyceps camponoti-rufipedis TaxID=2004952 RepID=A0A2C5YIF5_9HYPO|nr:hypothetical protein CDD80_166 [Ophiocordyceps camponoti-rufipedis]